MAKLERAIGYDGGPIQQRPDELEQFVQLVKDNGVRSYLEIGVRHGRTLYAVGTAMPKQSRLFAIDTVCTPEMSKSLLLLQQKGYNVYPFFGDSRSPNIIRSIAAWGELDLVLIDGDHTSVGVTADFNNYGLRARIVAFHDIDYEGYGVQALWQSIKQSNKYTCQEIIGRTRGMGFGIAFMKTPPDQSFKRERKKSRLITDGDVGLGTDDAGD